MRSPGIDAFCREAERRDIRSWSFGVVVKVRPERVRTWADNKGTLDDQAIFGPLEDDRCACRKYVGPQYRNYVCDVCGVKVTSRQARRTRFGHINLAVPIRHDLCTANPEDREILPRDQRPTGAASGDSSGSSHRLAALPPSGGTHRIDCFPVLPAELRESPGGAGLNALYEELLQADAKSDATAVRLVYNELCALLSPVIVTALQWARQDAELLANGLGLVLRRPGRSP